jgi:hypothetical protein
MTKCPKCGFELPDDLIKSAGARLMSEARKKKVGGFADPKVAKQAGKRSGKARRKT